MDRGVPPAPEDPDVRGRIDKIASYVAKKGPQAEERVRADHEGNPNFGFLFGHDYADYYRFALQCEIFNMQNNLPPGSRPGAQQSASSHSSLGSHPDAHPQHDQQAQGFDYAAAQARIDQLQQEIVKSEQNLRAHLDAIPTMKEIELTKAIEESEWEKVQSYLQRVNLDVSGLDDLLQQLHAKCSKDVVSQMKKWIFDYCTTDQLREVCLTYLLYRVRASTASEQFRLHVLYLINDWAHHCHRKKLDNIRKTISRYVPNLYAFAAENVADPNVSTKLDKLIGTWEGSKYFDDNCFKQLRNPSMVIQTYRGEHAKLGLEVQARLMATYAGYEKQHEEFATHMRNQITAIEAQMENERAKAESVHRKSLPGLLGSSRRSRFDCGPPTGEYGGFFTGPPAPAPGTYSKPGYGEPSSASGSWSRVGGDEENLDGEPIEVAAAQMAAPPEIDESALIPRVPFYDLPAGVIMGQIGIGDLTFKAIEVSKLRMPAPLPPTPRLMRAVDAFYATDAASRDSMGWEHGGLDEFFDRKSRLRKVLEETHCINGKTFEDLITNRPSERELEEEADEREATRRRELERSMRRSLSRSGSRSRSRSRSISRSRSRSRGRRSRSGSSRSSSRSRGRRSRSRSHSRSLSPERRVAFSRRSPSPPARYSFSNSSGRPNPLAPDNKGAQLMAKMGWQGRGLGANEHGIQEPVSGGEVRDKGEKFKGLGHEVDDFERFRQQRSSAYAASARRFQL